MRKKKKNSVKLHKELLSKNDWATKLYEDDFVRLVDGEIDEESLDAIYHISSLIEMLEDMSDNGQKLMPNEKYVRMTDLREDQKTIYLNFFKSNPYIYNPQA